MNVPILKFIHSMTFISRDGHFRKIDPKRRKPYITIHSLKLSFIPPDPASSIYKTRYDI